MHIAYLDEFGHIGPYVSKTDTRYKTHPVFGLGGLILPAERVREFGSFFHNLKRRLLAFEVAQSGVHPNRWEKKGASLLTSKNVDRYPEVTRVMNRILNQIERLGGSVFFYGQVKPLGGPEIVQETSRQRYDHTMIQTIIRTGRALPQSARILMILDEVDDKSRLEALASAGGFMFSNTDGRKLIEPPLQVESHLYPTVQAADWLCALISRLSAYQLGNGWDEFAWAEKYFGRRLGAIATRGSKIYDPLDPDHCITRSSLLGS